MNHFSVKIINNLILELGYIKNDNIDKIKKMIIFWSCNLLCRNDPVHMTIKLNISFSF